MLARKVVKTRRHWMFSWITGRPVDDTMPSQYEELTTLALSRMTATLAYQEQPEQIETIADFLVLTSFSAGAYSETRRSLTELRDAKLISGDPILNGMLMPLLTDERLEWWFSWWTGVTPPAFEVTEVNWDGTWILPRDWPYMAEPIVNMDAWSW